ncbi:hypothetical protein OHAE_378 [Ochrobactrum soli]|uniref:Uncharacterized protein n=1 Tax=Ochrobactrum soli TaxID=2448455 RepID=A0A2P9HK35_9HYPH|nr:hypothetical protein OHAE_378 [[Ochrobactrum] soli]
MRHIERPRNASNALRLIHNHYPRIHTCNSRTSTLESLETTENSAHRLSQPLTALCQEL